MRNDPLMFVIYALLFMMVCLQFLMWELATILWADPNAPVVAKVIVTLMALSGTVFTIAIIAVVRRE